MVQVTHPDIKQESGGRVKVSLILTRRDVSEAGGKGDGGSAPGVLISA